MCVCGFPTAISDHDGTHWVLRRVSNASNTLIDTVAKLHSEGISDGHFTCKDSVKASVEYRQRISRRKCKCEEEEKILHLVYCYRNSLFLQCSVN